MLSSVSMLTLLGNIANELIMSFYWHSDSVRSYAVAFVVNIATNTLNVAPNYGLVSFCRDKVGQEICLWFPSQD